MDKYPSNFTAQSVITAGRFLDALQTTGREPHIVQIAQDGGIFIGFSCDEDIGHLKLAITGKSM